MQLNLMTIAKCEEKSVSVAIEEIEPAQWAEKVYRPDILDNEVNLYEKWAMILLDRSEDKPARKP